MYKKVQNQKKIESLKILKVKIKVIFKKTGLISTLLLCIQNSELALRRDFWEIPKSHPGIGYWDFLFWARPKNPKR